MLEVEQSRRLRDDGTSVGKMQVDESITYKTLPTEVIPAAGRGVRRNNTFSPWVRRANVGMEVCQKQERRCDTATGCICRRGNTQAPAGDEARSKGPEAASSPMVHILSHKACTARDWADGWPESLRESLNCVCSKSFPDRHRTTKARTRLSQPHRSPQRCKGESGARMARGPLEVRQR
jgi:hypothetical protein